MTRPSRIASGDQKSAGAPADLPHTRNGRRVAPPAVRPAPSETPFPPVAPMQSENTHTVVVLATFSGQLLLTAAERSAAAQTAPLIGEAGGVMTTAAERSAAAQTAPLIGEAGGAKRSNVTTAEGQG